MKWVEQKDGIFSFFYKKICRNIPGPTGGLKIDHRKSGEQAQTALVPNFRFSDEHIRCSIEHLGHQTNRSGQDGQFFTIKAGQIFILPVLSFVTYRLQVE